MGFGSALSKTEIIRARVAISPRTAIFLVEKNVDLRSVFLCIKMGLSFSVTGLCDTNK